MDIKDQRALFRAKLYPVKFANANANALALLYVYINLFLEIVSKKSANNDPCRVDIEKHGTTLYLL